MVKVLCYKSCDPLAFSRKELTQRPTPWSRVSHKVTVSQLVEKRLPLCAAGRFVTEQPRKHRYAVPYGTSHHKILFVRDLFNDFLPYVSVFEIHFP